MLDLFNGAGYAGPRVHNLVSDDVDDLVPCDGYTDLSARAKRADLAPPVESLSPAVALTRITPFRVIDVGPEVIHEFWTIAAPKNSSARYVLKDPTVKRQCAFITVHKTNGTFKMVFDRPHEGPPQAYLDMPMSQLPSAVKDLLDAGFGRGP